MRVSALPPTGAWPHGGRIPPRTGLVTTDRRRAQAPPLAVRHAHERHARRGVTDGDQAWRCEPGPAAAPAGGVPAAARPDRAAGGGPRGRVVQAGPRTAAHPDGQVPGLASGARGQAQGPHGRGGTDRHGRQRPGSRLRRGGRARWTSDPAPVPTRTPQGAPGAPPAGPGAPPLAGGWARGRRRAGGVDPPQPRCGAWWPAGWATRGRQRRRGARRRASGSDAAWASRRQRCDARWEGLQHSSPRVTREAAAAAARAAPTPGPRPR